MFRQHERAGLKDEDSSAASGVVDEQLLGRDRAKSAPANDNRVELALAPANG